MFEDADNFADLFRGGLPYYLLITLPILIICSSNPVLASSDFPIQRMSQFDVHGVSYGCRASALNLEAKSLLTWTTSRHCVVTRFQDLTVDQFREIRAKAGGLIMLLPEDLSLLSSVEKQQIYLLEQAMMAQEISIPVYFSKYNKDLDVVIDDISISARDQSPNSNKKRESALTEIINSVSANGYQVLVGGTNHAANKQSKIPIIQGELVPTKLIKSPDGSGSNIEVINKLPLIIITAHMNTFGLINDQLNSIDISIFLTLIEAFSKLYHNASTAPRHRILFLLSESGSLMNFQGMKKWLDVNLEENSSIQNAEFVLCIDSMRENIENIYMHVSKPPKEGSQMSRFFKILKNSAQKFANVTLEGVHKKINLADVQLAWEHERFSMKRMPGFTVSSFKSHKDPLRTTIFKQCDSDAQRIAQKNAKILAEALAAYVFDISIGEIFSGLTEISDDMVRPGLKLKSTVFNNNIKNAFEKYLKNVKITYEKPDLREPDFMFYDAKDGVLSVYRVKPAVFDLFLTIAIVSYLILVYFVITLFPELYSAISKLSNNNKTKNN